MSDDPANDFFHGPLGVLHENNTPKSEIYRVTAGGKYYGSYAIMQDAINLRDNLHLDGLRDAAVEALTEHEALLRAKQEGEELAKLGPKFPF